MKYLFLLGAADPEMDRMVEVLKTEEQSFVFATKDGKRVNPSNAYEADPVSTKGYDALVRIECECAASPVSKSIQTIIIDHHREGKQGVRPDDPGFGKEASLFWEASSLGQLHKLLRLTPTPKDLTLAAMDHCYPAAFLGKCPGVAPADVLALKEESISKTTHTDIKKIRKFVDDFSKEMALAEEITINNEPVKDMRHIFLGVGYTYEYLAAQTAVTLSGKPALLCGREDADGTNRITLYGNAEKKTFEVFKCEWALSQGLVKEYGVPDRLYAGAYEPLPTPLPAKGITPRNTSPTSPSA